MKYIQKIKNRISNAQKKYRNNKIEREELKRLKRIVESRGKKKIFVIGFNKTGTTSMELALKDLGFIEGDQWKFTLMFDNYIRGLISFKKILNYCDTAEFFQDVPFSFPGFWKEVYKKYPDAYYILTVRDSSEKWFSSLFKFHSQVYGDGKTLNETDLKNSYNGTGMAWRFINYVYPNIELYNENEYKKIYKKHNKEIVEFFIGKANFLKINISEENSYDIFCDFLQVKKKYDKFPWLNKTK